MAYILLFYFEKHLGTSDLLSLLPSALNLFLTILNSEKESIFNIKKKVFDETLEIFTVSKWETNHETKHTL